MHALRTKSRNGFLLIETVLGVAIALVFTVAFLASITASQKMSRKNTVDFVAALYLHEAVEAARDLEISDWSEFENPSCAAPAICRLGIASGAWTLAPGEETIDGMFTRSLSISAVERDTLDFPNTIVETGGVTDPNTKRVNARISWTDNTGARVKTLETYVYRY